MRAVYKLLAAAGGIGVVLCAIQFVMAIRYGELGRVVVYLFLGLFCLELIVLGAIPKGNDPTAL